MTTNFQDTFLQCPALYLSHLIDDTDDPEFAAPIESYKERGLSWRRKCGVRVTYWTSRHILKGLLKETARTMRRTVIMKSQAPIARLQGLWQMSFTNTFYPQMVPKVKERLLTCNSCLFPVQDRKLVGQGDKRVQKCHVFLVLLNIFGVNLIINCS